MKWWGCNNPSGVAQLVERLTVNQVAVGSSPTPGVLLDFCRKYGIMNSRAVDEAFSGFQRRDLEVFAQYSMCCQSTQLYMKQHLPSGDVLWARDILWGSYPAGTPDIPSIVSLTDTNAQQLMDMLWRCGFRPTEGRGSAGALAATQAHLNDFRAIVAKQLKVQL